MKKKQYISPLSEVTHFGSGILMQALGPASMPSEPFTAPKRRKTEVF